MAFKKLDKTFSPKSKNINYLNKTFPEFRQSLIDFAKVYFPDSYNDFNESSPGMMFIEMASYVGDVLSYYMDTQFRENLLPYAQEPSSVISIAQALGYKPKPGAASTTTVDVYQLCPATDISSNYIPDSRYLLKIDSGMVLSSTEYGVSFRTLRLIDFADKESRTVTVYAVDGLGKPLTYLIKKTAKVVSGTIKQIKHVFDTPQRFSKIRLPDQNVLEIISVIDTSGNKWYEVDYLAQDLVLDNIENTRTALSDESIAPYYTLKFKKVPRRFVTRYNTDYFLEMYFGSGVTDDTSANINLDPNKLYNSEYLTNIASTALNPSDFLSSNSYGLAPSNTELTIDYSVGGGVESNVPSNSIRKVDSISILNDLTGFTPTERDLFLQIQSSVAVNNSESATGGREADSVEEIRQNAMAFFNSQNRLVTSGDYVSRCHAMPPRYGSVSKAFVVKDEQLNSIMRNTNDFAPTGTEFANDAVNPNVVNLYVLGYNEYGKLVKLNLDTKKNLKSYLETYRILTDQINILDAFVVNIAVEFNVVTYKNYNMNEVLARCISSISEFFKISKWDINQPIIINDLLLEIAQVEGVQSVTDLKIKNRYAYSDGSDYENYLYDIEAATERGVIFPSLDPCIFELRYPERDIIGQASQ